LEFLEFFGILLAYVELIQAVLGFGTLKQKKNIFLFLPLLFEIQKKFKQKSNSNS
jgi:hypothetical protein